jgi:hypothetical protein
VRIVLTRPGITAAPSPVARTSLQFARCTGHSYRRHQACRAIPTPQAFPPRARDRVRWITSESVDAALLALALEYIDVRMQRFPSRTATSGLPCYRGAGPEVDFPPLVVADDVPLIVALAVTLLSCARGSRAQTVCGDNATMAAIWGRTLPQAWILSSRSVGIRAASGSSRTRHPRPPRQRGGESSDVRQDISAASDVRFR